MEEEEAAAGQRGSGGAVAGPGAGGEGRSAGEGGGRRKVGAASGAASGAAGWMEGGRAEAVPPAVGAEPVGNPPIRAVRVARR